MTKKIKSTKRTSDEDNGESLQIDVQYNPDIVAGLLQELGQQVDSKCSQIQADTNFIIMQLQQQFQIELIKIPTQIKKMSISKFREQYGESLDLAPKNNPNSGGDGKMRPPLGLSSNHQNMANNNNSNSNSSNVMETPFAKPFNNSNKLGVNQGPLGTAMRAPREGEFILSANGSPLGGFTTAQKLPNNKPNNLNMPPQTPGVFVPLKTGEIIDIENTDMNALDKNTKDDALLQMQSMIENMQKLMGKMQTSSLPKPAAVVAPAPSSVST